MKKLALNLAALAVVLTGSLSLATPASANGSVSTRASCTQGSIRLEGSVCTVVNGNCACR